MKSYIHLYKTNSEFTKAYNGSEYIEPWLSLTEEGMKVNYNKPKLTAITFDSITWVTDIPATGGTATKDNCSFKVYANYDNGSFLDISSDATVTGELVVPSSTEGQRHEIEQPLTLTASYSGFTATGNVTAYQAAAVDFSTEPLTFNILSAGTINWTASDASIAKTIDYKLNDGGWTSITSSTDSSAPSIEVNSGDKLQFKGNNAQYATSESNYNSFGGSALFESEGNIMSLIYGDDFKNKLTISNNYAFTGLFSECTGLTSAENLILPATTLASYCYAGMFAVCSSLTTAPKLPATTLADDCYSNMFAVCSSLKTTPELPATSLADYCYSNMFNGCTSLTTATKLPANTLVPYCYEYMFQGCTSLTTAPALPATTLADSCYGSMFAGCKSLTTAPALPATTLADSCYGSMFAGCKSLTTAPALPATTLAENCYAMMFAGCSSLTISPALPATTLAGYCYGYMFQGCTSLTTAPALPTTTLASKCYYYMFQGCTSLKTAPELPATTLAFQCYYSMFDGCTSLNYIKCLATNISAFDCTSYWVDHVAATGKFVKASSMTSWGRGNNGIPYGWTVEEYIDYTKEPLTFKISSPGTVNWAASDSSASKTIEYKLNDSNNWTSITSNTGESAPSITVTKGDKLQFRGNNTAYCGDNPESHSTFGGSTAGFEVEGNIMSLINSTDFITTTTLDSEFTFVGLFSDCTGLTSAENLILPATTLANGCYDSMFMNCTSLTTAPALPATTLTRECYYGMFNGCTNLTTAPALPATTLTDNCYNSMFQGCTNLTTAPTLPATTLAGNCYRSMFNGCTSLNYIKCLATDISTFNCTSNWVNGVASKGTFVKAPSMTSWATGTKGIPKGWTVQDAS